jgi:hypothetical protein
MRRGLSIFLILFFSLAPLASALAANDESRLPPCCRRHGAHHCAMMARWRAQMASSKPAVSAPNTCPLFPGYGLPSIASLDALAAAPIAPPSLFVQGCKAQARREAVRQSPMSTRAGRGPPASILG